MRKYFFAILMALPMLATAQDNTWERIHLGKNRAGTRRSS